MWSVWMALAGCGSAAPEPEPAPVEAPEPAKRSKGKRKAKAGGGCPDGVVVNPGWEGEYPDPIADVTEAVAVPARAEPCQRAATLECTVPAGLYHPWSEVEAEYRTVRGVDRYEVLKDTRIGDVEVSAGTEVAVVAYLAEGFCMFDAGGRQVESTCPEVVGEDTFRKLSVSKVPKRQLVRVACEGGRQLWVDEADLMKQPGVQQGKVLEFGKVGPAR